jgi:L,D-transpeptidase catalytic domain
VSRADRRRARGRHVRRELSAAIVTLVTTLAIAVSTSAASPALATPALAPPSARALAASAVRSGARPAARLRAPGPRRAWVAHVLYRTFARSAPRARASRRAFVPAVSHWGTPTVLLVLARRIGPEGTPWLRVLLDRRPNGAAVWLDADDTRLSVDRWRLRISLRRRRVIVYRAGRPVRTFAAVVGKPATPTPVGLFAIAAELRQPAPDGFVGSWVLPLTAHSDVLRRFDGGDGQVALHGRGGASLLDPLGSARSHGCVRIANSAIAWIARHVPAGTPVSIG